MAKKPEADSGVQKLKSDLKEKQLGHFYILYGEEDYLRKYYFEQLRHRLLDELTEDFNFHPLNGESFSLEALADAVETLPMMAERSMIWLDEIDLFAQADSDSLVKLLSDLPEHCCLICTYSEFKPDKRKKKLWEAVEKNAVLAEFRYQSESDLRAWISRHFKAQGKQIAPELCNYLLTQCGLSMTRLHGEIGKICAYSGAEAVVRTDIDAVVEPTLDAVVFQITDALGQREYDKAMERLSTLLKMQTDPIPIVAAIGAQMRRLYAAKILQSEGKGAGELTSLCAIAPYAANKTLSQARRFSLRFCREAVLLCARTDYALKTSYDSPERLAELLILRLAQEERND